MNLLNNERRRLRECVGVYAEGQVENEVPPAAEEVVVDEGDEENATHPEGFERDEEISCIPSPQHRHHVQVRAQVDGDEAPPVV